MTLLHVLIPVGYFQVPPINGVGVVYNCFERSTVIEVESSINPHENSFGGSYEADAFHNNRLKTNRLLRVLFKISYAIKLRLEVQDRRLTNLDRLYVIALGGHFFSISIATYHPCQSLHTGACRNFGEINPDIPRRVRRWRP